MRALAIGLLAGLLAGSGCSDEPADRNIQRTILALGTLITVDIRGADHDAGEVALDKLESYFNAIQRDWYAFGDGELGRINRALSTGKPAPISADLGKLIHRSLMLREQSDGWFDPTVGLLVELWGFDDTSETGRIPPDDLAIKRWQQTSPGRSRVRIEDGIITAGTALKIDLGGIAKGTALTRAAAMLTTMGIHSALIDAGGDLIALGLHGQRKWRIGVRDPQSHGVLGTIELAPGEAILSSGNYERYFEYQDKTYHHLLDPRTGFPVAHTAGVTVIHTDAERADAAATALMAAGPERFHELARQMGIEFAMLVPTDGEVIMTTAMAGRLTPSRAKRVVRTGDPR
jgi:thiamine biosynthesis lipoprotein